MAVTFTHTLPGTYDAGTGVWSTPTTETVSGPAMQVSGDPDVYRDLSLVEAEAPTLFWAPNTYGDAAPGLGWTVTWANTVYTVRSVQVLAPDGVVITARLVIGK